MKYCVALRYLYIPVTRIKNKTSNVKSAINETSTKGINSPAVGVFLLGGWNKRIDALKG